jgi:hypothetical protein
MLRAYTSNYLCITHTKTISSYSEILVGMTDGNIRQFSILITTPSPYTIPAPIYVIVSRGYPHELSVLLEKDQMLTILPYYLICDWFFQYERRRIKKSRGGIDFFSKYKNSPYAISDPLNIFFYIKTENLHVFSLIFELQKF